MTSGNPEHIRLMNSVVEFARSGPERGVNSFNLRGPIDVPTKFHTFAALFPKLYTADTDFAILGTDPTWDSMTAYKRILALSLPERIKRLDMPDTHPLREHLSVLLASYRSPTIVLGFGQAVKPQAEVAVLFAITGISPATALREIQDRVRERKTGLN